MMHTSFDVIVVGGGGSGLAAAVSAAEQGCRVLLLEKQPRLGGTTGLAVGSFTGNRTRMQQRAGIEDDVEEHEADAGKFAPREIEACNNPELRRFFLSETADTLDWLQGFGLTFFGPSPEPPNRVPRMHNVVPGAKAYIAALHARMLRLGGQVICSADVTRLLIDNAGRVTGVEAALSERVESFRAACGVVLAAGDYANSPEFIARSKGARFASVEGINPHATGDGHRLAEAAGAALLNMEVTYGPEIRFVAPPGKPFHQLIPSRGLAAAIVGGLLPYVPGFVIHKLIRRLLVTWQHPENALFDDGAILLNSHGERFCNEKSWPGREIAIASQPGKIAYLLLDARLIARYSSWPHFISTAPQIAYAYVADYLRLRPDVALDGRGLAALASRRGLPTEAVESAVEQYNLYVSGSLPDPFGRAGDTEILHGNRWLLLGPVKAWFTTTEGGVAINRQFQALDPQGEPILGLYAVGQNGLGGQILWGHGLHIAWALTSGRLVGRVLGEARMLAANTSANTRLEPEFSETCE